MLAYRVLGPRPDARRVEGALELRDLGLEVHELVLERGVLRLDVVRAERVPRREQERAFSRARARRARNGAGETARESDRSDSVDDDEFFEIPVRSRWAFRLERLRDAAHADVLAWNMQFGKLPSAPF